MGLRIGTVSISRKIPPLEGLSFDRLWHMVGQNTGNLMFTEAIYRLLDAEVTHLGFRFDPDFVNSTQDAVVIPAANWLYAGANWDVLSDRIEKLTVPVTIVGIGVQAERCDLASVQVSESAIRFVRLVAERSEAIGVRGEFTRDWLRSIGIANAVSIGCPSLYMNAFGSALPPSDNDFIVQATRYYVTAGFAGSHPVEKHFFRRSTALGVPMIYQSEPEELEAILMGGTFENTSPEAISALLDLYGLEDLEALRRHLAEFGNAFVSLDEWSVFVKRHRGVIGSRLHGTILALNSGVPAALVAHDSRTQEVAEFAGLPTLSGDDVMSLVSRDDFLGAIDRIDIDRYRDIRSRNQKAFVRFLTDAGLPARSTAMF